MIRFAATFLCATSLVATPLAAQSSLEEGLRKLLEAAIESQLKPQEEPKAEEQAAPTPQPQLNQNLQPTPRELTPAEMLAEPFDAKGLNRAEKRVLQAGLALEGHYNALLDGAWGRGSQSSMTAMTRKEHRANTPTWQHAIDLQNRLANEVQTNGWQVTGTRDNAVSLLLPMRQMRPASARRGAAWQSVRRDMQVRILPQSLSETVTLANAIASRHEGRGDAYFRQTGNRVVVSAETGDGGGIYMRNFEIGGGLRTALIEWDQSASVNAKLIIASLRAGQQTGLELPKGGMLDQLMNASSRPRATAPANNGQTGFWPEVNAPKTDELVLRDFSAKRDVRGNGFYINNTDVLTALHTVENCKNPQFDAKTPAQIIATDKTRGLAILTSTNRSTAWLPISRAFPNKGEDLIVLGYGANEVDAPLRAEIARLNRRAAESRYAGMVVTDAQGQFGDFGSAALNGQRQLAAIMINHPRGDRRVFKRLLISAPKIQEFLDAKSILFERVNAADRGVLTEKRLNGAIVRVLCGKS